MVSGKLIASMVLVAGLCVGGAMALTQDEAAKAAEAARQAAEAGKQAAQQAAEQAMKDVEAMKQQEGAMALNTIAVTPKGIPVPNGPVVETKKLDNGLLIEDLVIGTGSEVKEGGSVVAYYHGTFTDGKVFDSAFERGEPIGFPLGNVIQGWQVGVPGMKVGGVRRLTIPYTLAYGEAGKPPTIPAKSDLVFTIQLVDMLGVTDTVEGTGEAAGELCVAVTACTVKNDQGEVLMESSKDKPFIWIPDDMQGMRVGIAGMKVGGKRTIRVPKDFAQGALVMGAGPVSLPSGQDLTVECELLAVRNLSFGQ